MSPPTGQRTGFFRPSRPMNGNSCARIPRGRPPLGQVLFEGGAAFDRLYFPTLGVISAFAVLDTGQAAEMATTGREGMVGVGAILGSDTSLSRQLVQVPGPPWCSATRGFTALEPSMPALRRILFAYAQAFLAQVLQSVACNGAHSVEERAARWLLMCHDRSED